MKNFLSGFFLAVFVSCFFFPFGLHFLPSGINTKIIMAGFGILAFVLYCIRNHQMQISRITLVSALIAVTFSLWCLFSITANGTDDTSYVMYWVSFATWLGGAYGVYTLLRLRYGRVDLDLLTRYLAIVCVAQCVLALMIDNIPAFQRVVDAYVDQGQEFFQEVHRMYGIGAALDSAGVRFSVVLVLIAHQIATNAAVYDSKSRLTGYILAFIVISVVGNMIARTTSIGMGLGLFYILAKYFTVKQGGDISGRQIRLYAILFTLLAAAVYISVTLYQSSPAFRQNIRFAFEGFFNWAETGEFSTGSTDKLNAQMWVWPEGYRAWMIGNGIFGNWYYSTDIGYCRFTLYCGLIGLAIFSLFFIYNGLALNGKFRKYSFLSLLLIALTFIIWLKVSTDIFFIYALLFCIDGDEDGEEPVPAV